MTDPQSTKFIVYELRRPDGTVFYVGKGRHGRPREHMERARRGERSHKANVIRKIERSGQSVVVAIVFQTDNERAAFAEEVRRIAEYQGSGVVLTNLTEGGEGISGYTHTAETRAVIAAASRRHVVSKETREKLRVANIGKIISPECRAKLSVSVSEATKGKPKSPEHRAKMSARLRSQEMREKAIAAITGRPCSEETRAKIGAANKGRTSWSKGKTRESPSEEVRAKIRKGLRAYRTKKSGQLSLEGFLDVG